MGTAKLPRGFGAGPAPGATATDCASSTGSVTSAAASPQLSRSVPSPAFLDRAFAVGRVYFSDFAIYYFFFFAAFLAFLFFAITSLRQRLKKQAQRPSCCGGRFDRRENPPANLASLGMPSDSNLFSARILGSLARSNYFAQKIFSSIAHIEQSSKKFLGEKQQRQSSAECSRACAWLSTALNFARRHARRANSSALVWSEAPALDVCVLMRTIDAVRDELRGAIRAPSRKRISRVDLPSRVAAARVEPRSNERALVRRPLRARAIRVLGSVSRSSQERSLTWNA